MEASVRLGTIRGIEIGIHSSWLIVFALLTYSLSESIFPSLYDDWTTTEYWGAGVVASLLLFASVIAHEFGHAIMAQSKGVSVRSITLFIFGGVALLEKESEEAGDEFWIAVAGPAVSVAVAVLAGAAWIAAESLNEQLAGILVYLAYMNVILVLFNMIPAYPLDGGRVFRAILWGATRSLEKATRISSTVGMIIGFLFIGVGVFTVFANPISGIWLVAIGWFLRSAAQQAYQQLTLSRVFEGVRVESLMNPDPVTVTPGVTLDDLVAGYVLGQNVRGLPVVDAGRLAGMITVSDIRDVPQEQWSRRTVGERMTPFDRVVAAAPETGLADALQLMSEQDLHQLPVVRDGRLVGLLTRNALIRFLQLRQELPLVEPVTIDRRRRVHRAPEIGS
jgi:Zn-dependent protease/CBS domain-containing protein